MPRSRDYVHDYNGVRLGWEGRCERGRYRNLGRLIPGDISRDLDEKMEDQGKKEIWLHKVWCVVVNNMILWVIYQLLV